MGKSCLQLFLVVYLLENYSNYFDDLLALGRAIVAFWATCILMLVLCGQRKYSAKSESFIGVDSYSKQVVC